MSTNLPWTALASNQDNPEPVINEAFGLFDAALTETYTVDLSAGNATVTLVQSTVRRVILDGAATAGRIATFTAGKRAFYVQSGSTETVTMKVGTTEIEVAPSDSFLAFMDGTTNGLEQFMMGGGGGTGLPPGGDYGEVLAKLSSADGDAGWVTPSGGTPPTPAFRYYQLKFLTAPTVDSNNPSVAEWQLLEFSTGDRLFPTATSSDTEINSSNGADKLQDGNPATHWHGAVGSAFPQSIYADMGAEVSIGFMRFLCRSGQPNQAPATFEILARNDPGDAWEDVGAGDTFAPTWSDGVFYDVDYGGAGPAAPAGFALTYCDAAVASTTQSIGASFDTVTLADVDDPEGLFASNLYTVPEDGVYLIVASVRAADSTADNTQFGFGVHTSNGDGPWFHWHDTSGAMRSTRGYTRTMRCSAGQQLRLFAYGPFTLIAAGLTIVRIA